MGTLESTLSLVFMVFVVSTFNILQLFMAGFGSSVSSVCFQAQGCELAPKGGSNVGEVTSAYYILCAQ